MRCTEFNTIVGVVDRGNKCVNSAMKTSQLFAITVFNNPINLDGCKGKRQFFSGCADVLGYLTKLLISIDFISLLTLRVINISEYRIIRKIEFHLENILLE